MAFMAYEGRLDTRSCSNRRCCNPNKQGLFKPLPEGEKRKTYLCYNCNYLSITPKTGQGAQKFPCNCCGEDTYFNHTDYAHRDPSQRIYICINCNLSKHVGVRDEDRPLPEIIRVRRYSLPGREAHNPALIQGPGAEQGAHPRRKSMPHQTPMYRELCNFCNHTFVQIPLEDWRKLVNKPKPAGVVIQPMPKLYCEPCKEIRMDDEKGQGEDVLFQANLLNLYENSRFSPDRLILFINWSGCDYMDIKTFLRRLFIRMGSTPKLILFSSTCNATTILNVIYYLIYPHQQPPGLPPRANEFAFAFSHQMPVQTLEAVFNGLEDESSATLDITSKKLRNFLDTAIGKSREVRIIIDPRMGTYNSEALYCLARFFVPTWTLVLTSIQKSFEFLRGLPTYKIIRSENSAPNVAYYVHQREGVQMLGYNQVSGISELIECFDKNLENFDPLVINNILFINQTLADYAAAAAFLAQQMQLKNNKIGLIIFGGQAEPKTIINMMFCALEGFKQGKFKQINFGFSATVSLETLGRVFQNGSGIAVDIANKSSQALNNLANTCHDILLYLAPKTEQKIAGYLTRMLFANWAIVLCARMDWHFLEHLQNSQRKLFCLSYFAQEIRAAIVDYPVIFASRDEFINVQAFLWYLQQEEQGALHRLSLGPPMSASSSSSSSASSSAASSSSSHSSSSAAAASAAAQPRPRSDSEEPGEPGWGEGYMDPPA